MASPPAPELADGVFVEDTVVIVDGLAVITRPGAMSRRPEIATLGADLAGLGLTVVAIEPPATLDGGDVLQVGDTLYVGRTGRTNDRGAQQLASIVEPLGRRVVQVAVSGALHLKTVVTALPDGSLVGLQGRFDAGVVTAPMITVPEPAGANVLAVGGTVVVSSSAPKTGALLADRGVPVELVDITEFERCEAGVTCLSVLVTAAAG